MKKIRSKNVEVEADLAFPVTISLADLIKMEEWSRQIGECFLINIAGYEDVSIDRFGELIQDEGQSLFNECTIFIKQSKDDYKKLITVNMREYGNSVTVNGDQLSHLAYKKITTDIFNEKRQLKIFSRIKHSYWMFFLLFFVSLYLHKQNPNPFSFTVATISIVFILAKHVTSYPLLFKNKIILEKKKTKIENLSQFWKDNSNLIIVGFLSTVVGGVVVKLFELLAER